MLASGSGTNLQAILDRLHGRGEVEVVGVASDKPGARALERAAAAGVDDGRLRSAPTTPTAASRDAAIGDWLESARLRARRPRRLHAAAQRRVRRGASANRIINVHPALLPAFPGLDAIGQALAHGVRVTGVTVHFVDEGVDTGPILLQRAVELTYTRPVHEVTERDPRASSTSCCRRAIELIADGAVSDRPRQPAIGADRGANEREADDRRQPAPTRASREPLPSPPGADLGLRQERRRRVRPGACRRSGSRSSPPAAPPRR